MDATGQVAGAGDAEAQIRQVFVNLAADAAPASSRRHLRRAAAPPRARTVPMVRGSSAPLQTAHWSR
ncbi:hypothetical protein Daura_19195 [Dactylosporangium aurantiacum]|uniref:Uncharacterized protein n=1 Tax=Dactylosporangium aurantiacum TaxID=35754 RepID=A0A9Q9IQQ6_9ACTN|nr:hypothetical protein Daura_19195 [Dactylosporangium aurantiacum]